MTVAVAAAGLVGTPARPLTAVGDRLSDLARVLEPAVGVALWDRTLPPTLAETGRALALVAPFTVVVEDAVSEAVGALAAALPIAVPTVFLEEVHHLASEFAEIAGTRGVVRLRLQGITGPGCFRWHADAVGLRLLTTFYGDGTELLAIAGGAQAARRLRADALPASPYRMAMGAVGILKGDGYPGNAGFGCIHRSPPAGVGQDARVLLCLDEPGRIPVP